MQFDISATNEKKKSFIFVTYQNMSPINVFTEVFLFEFVFNKTNPQYLYCKTQKSNYMYIF